MRGTACRLAQPDPAGGGAKLTALLDAFGVTRAKLAEALGYSPSYISRVCSQTRNVSNFDEFAQAAGTFFAERGTWRKRAGRIACLVQRGDRT